MTRRSEVQKGVELPAGSSRGQPYIDPSIGVVTASDAYAVGVRARQNAKKAPPKIASPVGGGPSPPMPRLDRPYREGMTMEQNALAERGGQAPQPMGIVEPVVRAGTGTLGIMPTDILPEQAKADPNFQPGFGSMFAVHQPALAMKYGVMRSGQYVPPQKLQPDRPQLRGQTMKDLEELERLRHHQDEKVGSLHATESEAEQSVGGAAAAAARIGNLPGDTSEKPLTEEEKTKLKEGIDKMDEFDLDSFRQMMMRDILNNPDQQKAIEKRLKPLSIDELIMNNRVEQDVSITPGKLWYTYQSMGGDDDQAIKRIIMQEAKSVEVTDRYLLDRYAFMSITVGLKSVNGKPLGEVYGSDGTFDDDQFWKKYKRILKLPMQMLASIGVNQFWFEARVRKLFVVETVGNG